MSATGANPLAYQGVRAPNPPNVIEAQRAPNSTDINYPLGTLWLDRVGGGVYMLTLVLAGAATWTGLGGGSSDVNTINSLSPTAGNINIVGTAGQVAVANLGSTITLSLPASLSGLTSVSSGTFVTSSATLGVTYTANSITATGSDADISLNLIPKGAGVVNVTGPLVASTTLTATLGPITATDGNLVLGTPGNKLQIATGADASIGVSAALSGTPGSVTVATTAVTASSIILISRNTPGGTLGNLSVPSASIVAGTSFVINSDANETSTINWMIIN